MITDYAAEYAKVSQSLTQTSMELVSVLNAKGYNAAATMLAELADRTHDTLKASALVAEVYLK